MANGAEFKLCVEMTIARLLHMLIDTSDKHAGVWSDTVRSVSKQFAQIHTIKGLTYQLEKTSVPTTLHLHL